MTEIAFKIEECNTFYNNYFKAKKEKEKSHKIAKSFLERNNLLVPDGQYIFRERLTITLDNDMKATYKNDILLQELQGLSVFKKTSKLNKKWVNEVYSNIDNKIMNSMNMWYFGYINKGRYNLWDYEGVIYGYLRDEYETQIELADFMKKIKMSEYYSVIEKLENVKQ